MDDFLGPETKKCYGKEDAAAVQWNAEQDQEALGSGSKGQSKTGQVREYRMKVETTTQQRKGDKAWRSKEAASLILREISLQLRIKGELAPIGGLREEASWHNCSLKGKGEGRKDGREGPHKGDSSEHVV